ncbi:MAG TPA: hypothetical protein EYO96_00620 [Candidatus Marinimicrobia bacterium]|nr:hypothetical protein [Candidatus Neomarinimicrobiota bacterium]
MFKINKGTVFCHSVVGHYNFYYPDKKPAVLDSNILAERLNWLQFAGMQAMKVKLSDLDDDSSLAGYAAIWIPTDTVNT